jgi:hypothetical protein
MLSVIVLCRCAEYRYADAVPSAITPHHFVSVVILSVVIPNVLAPVRLCTLDTKERFFDSSGIASQGLVDVTTTCPIWEPYYKTFYGRNQCPIEIS